MHNDIESSVDLSHAAEAVVDLSAWPLPLVGERIHLRRLRQSDLAALQAYRSDQQVGLYQGWEPMSELRAQAFIASMAQVQGPIAGEWVQLAIAARHDDALIGDAGVHFSADGREAELGLSLAREQQGRGLASEAFLLLISQIFREPRCVSIRGAIDARNLDSIKLVHRHGFEQIDSVDTIFRGEPCTELIFRLNNPLAVQVS